MNAPILDQDFLRPAEAESVLADLARQLRAGGIIPYLGPGLTELSAPSVPMTPEKLADFFGTKVALPRRARGNVWASAQYIEGQRHRSSVTNMMTEAFSPRVEPTPLHKYLASLPLPLVIDTWYDGAARLAFSERSDWGEIRASPAPASAKASGIASTTPPELRWTRAPSSAGRRFSTSRTAP